MEIDTPPNGTPGFGTPNPYRRAHDKCADFNECIAPKITAQLSEILSELQSLHTAFPVNSEGETDLAGHRRHHDAQIAAAKAEEAFWCELRLDLAKKGSWLLFLVIIGLLFTGFIAKIGNFLKGLP